MNAPTSCRWCGGALPAGAAFCPACGRPFNLPATPADPVEEALREAKRAAKELAAATARVSEYVLAKAKSAAADPPGAARKVLKRAADDLEAARRQVEQALRESK